MKKASILILIIFAILLIVGSISGIPISTQVEESGCRASYQKFLFPRELCQYLTFGHCATTSFNRYNAEIEISHCLCDKYLTDPNRDLENIILSKCDLIEPDCDFTIERIKNNFCNKEGLNSLECDEYFKQNEISKVQFICQNKKRIFFKRFIF